MGKQFDVGEKSISILYNTIDRHEGISNKNRRHDSLDYNSICYIKSRIGWVSMKGIFKYRCRRDPGKLSNNFCYTYLTKDQHPPSKLLVYTTVQYSTIKIMKVKKKKKKYIRTFLYYRNGKTMLHNHFTPRPQGTLYNVIQRAFHSTC